MFYTGGILGVMYYIREINTGVLPGLGRVPSIFFGGLYKSLNYSFGAVWVWGRRFGNSTKWAIIRSNWNLFLPLTFYTSSGVETEHFTEDDVFSLLETFKFSIEIKWTLMYANPSNFQRLTLVRKEFLSISVLRFLRIWQIKIQQFDYYLPP